MNRPVYLDYNATAPVRPEVRRACEPILFSSVDDGAFGNASSIHWAGQEARRQLEVARRKIAALFGRPANHVVFTSGGTEADNLAVTGLATPTEQIVISEVEHPAILAAAERVERGGTQVVRLLVDDSGQVGIDQLASALEHPTALVSVMSVNNETGIVSPIDAIIQCAHERNVLVHVDAVQSAGRLPLPTAADLVTISGHKIGGLKGSGALIVSDCTPIRSLVVGGPQERGHRAGTENVAGAVSLACALELAEQERKSENARLLPLRDRLELILSSIEGVNVIEGERVTNTVTAVFSGVEGEAVLQGLDLEGVAASSGSACSSGSLTPSHVLLALGISPQKALSAVRFSMGWGTTSQDLHRLSAVLTKVVKQAREGTEQNSA